jgi:hypothetical protein
MRCWCCSDSCTVDSAGLAFLRFRGFAPSQPFQIKGAQRIRTEAAALVVVVAGDVGVLLQQVRDAAKDGGADAIDAEVVEQQERLEGGVGRCRHSPVARRTEGRWR